MDFIQNCKNVLKELIPDSITDIYDGSLYREWMNNGFLKNPDNISFSWYTDGVPVFKSSKISM